MGLVGEVDEIGNDMNHVNMINYKLITHMPGEVSVLNRPGLPQGPENEPVFLAVLGDAKNPGPDWEAVCSSSGGAKAVSVLDSGSMDCGSSVQAGGGGSWGAMADCEGRRSFCPMMRYSPVRGCNTGTCRRAAMRFLIQQHCVGKRINGLWGGLRKI